MMFEAEKINNRATGLKTATEYDGKPIMWAYAFLIDHTLIDAGCANAAGPLSEFARSHKVNRVFITHTHEDHVGACRPLSNHATIYARPQHIPNLKHPPELDQFFVWVARRHVELGQTWTLIS